MDAETKAAPVKSAPKGYLGLRARPAPAPAEPPRTVPDPFAVSSGEELVSEPAGEDAITKQLDEGNSSSETSEPAANPAV